MPDDLTLAYMAGAIDADGYITIPRTKAKLATGVVRNYYVAQIGLGQITEMVPRLMYDAFGGHITHYDPPKDHHVPRWIWHATNTRAAVAVSSLLPFLRMKVAQANLVVQLTERLDANRGQLVSLEEEEVRESLWAEARRLNRPRNKRIRDAFEAEQLGGARPGTKLEDLPADLRIREFPA